MSPEAQQVFEILRLFWRRRRSIAEEPTEQELMRDVRDLLHGKKDGEVVVRNESDSDVKGEKVVIDNTQSAKLRATSATSVVQGAKIKEQIQSEKPHFHLIYKETKLPQ